MQYDRNNRTQEHFERLRRDNYQIGRWVYPSNLDSDLGVGHYIIFFINQPSGSKFVSKNKANKAKKQELKNKIADTYNTEKRWELQKKLHNIRRNEAFTKEGENKFTREKTEIRQGRSRLQDVIVLAMPKQNQVQYSNDWSGEDLNVFESIVTDAVGGKFDDFTSALNRMHGDVNMSKSQEKSIIGKVENFANRVGGTTANLAEFFGTAFAGGGSTRAFGKLNLVRNPHLEFFYKGISARSFQFEFNFTPSSQQDLRNSHNIAEAFKFHSHPELHERTAGIFFRYPSEFNMMFVSRGRENTWYHKVGNCALTNVAFDQGSNVDGAKFRDVDGKGGAPVQATLTLDFQELEIMTKEKIAKGF